MMIERYVRGWLAVALVQHMGLLLQLLVDPNILQRTFINLSMLNGSMSRLYATLFFAYTLQQLVVKVAVQIAFRNQTLHILEILYCAINLIFMGLETFYYQHFRIATAVLTQITFSGATILFTVIALSKLFLKKDDAVKQESLKSRSQLSLSEHYIKSQVTTNRHTNPKNFNNISNKRVKTK